MGRRRGVVSYMKGRLSGHELRKRIASIELFLFDLDGTVYLGNESISGAVEFIERLKSRSVDFLFLTNNSSKNRSDYVTKLNGMGFGVVQDQVITSGEVTAWYLVAKKPQASIYVMGTESLEEELRSFGCRIVNGTDLDADCVVAGFDTELTYQKLLVAGEFLSRGAAFIATNPDLVCPVEKGRYIPDCGSICTLLKNATGREPTVIGKPHSIMMDYIRTKRSISRRSIAMVGDRLSTDIAFGCNASIMTVCVLSGETDRQAAAQSPYQPDLVIDTIAELDQYLD